LPGTEKSPAGVEDAGVESKEQKKELPLQPAPERLGPAEQRAGPAETKAEPASQTIVVERGDTLGKLAARVYGRSNDRILELILKNNPTINDPDRILPGQQLFFPPIPEEKQ